MVKVSVIVPSYNRAALVGHTIENMLRQTLSPHEIIVVDDGSTDESVDVIRGFGDRVTLIQQSNQGPGVARNAGLKVATGEFIQFMDSDDLASLNKLEVQANALMEQQADIVYGPWAKVWITDDCIRPENVVLQQKALPPHHHPLHWFLTTWSMVFQQCLVRRSALEKAGGYREDMKLYEDGELFVRLLLSDARLIHESESLTLYRLDDHGKLTASGQQQQQRLWDTTKFYQWVIEQFRHHPTFHPILEHPEFRMSVHKALRPIPANITPDHPEAQAYSELVETYGSDFRQTWQIWLQEKQKGLQQRLRGHRWPSAYQAGPITVKQRSLIERMGLALA